MFDYTCLCCFPDHARASVKSKQTTNWWIDILLFAGFILTFFLDLTGLELHQWLGVLAGALAGWHLLRHMNWVTAVTKRFFSRGSSRTRSYYILDVLLFSSFLLILITGLVISTWLALPLSSYIAWVNVHIIGSITALVVLLLKILLHWRWITCTASRIARSVKAPAAGQPAHARAGTARMGRREFLKVLGISGAASMLALGSASSALSDIMARSNAAQQPTEPNSDPYPEKDTDTRASVDAPQESLSEISPDGADSTSHGGGGNRRRGGRGDNDTSATVDTPTPEEPAAASTPDAAPETVPTEVQPAAESCTVQCPRSCAYPGQCRKYIDSNGNGLCDLGECL